MSSLEQAFAALADPTRRGFVVHLARREATVSEPVDQFDLSRPTIYSHIKVLQSAAIISQTREAQTQTCLLEPERLEENNKWLVQVQDVWEGNYRRLDALLSELTQAQKERKK